MNLKRPETSGSPLKPGSRLRAVGVWVWVGDPRPLCRPRRAAHVSCRVSRPQLASRPAGAGRKGCAARGGRGGASPARGPPPSRCRPPAPSGAGPGGAAGGQCGGPGVQSRDAGCSARDLVGPEASCPRPPRHHARPGPGRCSRQSREVRRALCDPAGAPVPPGPLRLRRDLTVPPGPCRPHLSPQAESTGGRCQSLDAPSPLSWPLGTQLLSQGTSSKCARLRILRVPTLA